MTMLAAKACGPVSFICQLILTISDNQPNLKKDVAEFFEDVLNDPQKLSDIQHIHTADKGHGRAETRDYYLATNLDWMLYKDGWTSLHSVGAVISTVTCGENTTKECRYFISSLTDGRLFAKAARSHWGIENSLHWCLDMTFHEDYSRMRKDHTAENMAIVRHIALSALKLHPAKMSLARKKRHYSYDDEFLAQVLELIHA